MSGFWAMLGLEPTKDVSAIKRAYARAAKACHPEEDPEGFLRLRRAYEAALAAAEQETSAEGPMKLGNSRTDNRGRTLRGTGKESPESKESRETEEISFAEVQENGWRLHGGGPETALNPYQDGAAIGSFIELYAGDQRKNTKLWMDYFTSEAFLEAGWDSRFTALLLEKVTEAERTLPPCKEFLMWLCTAYQFSVKEKMTINREELQVESRERQVELCLGADFDGMDAILRIAAKGPLPKRPGGDELALRESFRDYRHLNRLADGGSWSAQAMEEFQNILRRYIPFYIKERCDPKADPDHQRHPAGLRMLLHFFRREDLPESLYRELWRELDLKSAVMGRAKILYGPLRELAAERISGIAGEPPENFLQLNRDHNAYRARIKECPEREEEESAAFFAREDLQRALQSPRFVAQQLLTYTNWRREGMGEGLIRRMLDFYRAHPEIPRADEAVSGLGSDLRARTAERRNREDAEAEAFHWYERVTLRYRPLVRHWLNTAFYTARDPETGVTLLEYLARNFPYQADWSRRFVEREDGSRPPRTMAVSMGEIEIDFYRRHMEYRINGRLMHRPSLCFQRVAEESGDWFLLLLPLAAAPADFYPSVEREIALRLSATALPEENRPLIARCLANAVCCLPLDEYTRQPLPPERVLPLTVFAETEDQLFGCSWYEGSGELTLFEQTSAGRRIRKRCNTDPERAEAEARSLLDEAVSPEGFCLFGMELPWNIYYTEPGGSEQTLTRPDLIETEETLEPPEMPSELLEMISEERGPVSEDELEPAPEEKRPFAEEDLQMLLARFGKGELERLELRWFEGELVFRREPAGCACFYFERTGGYHIWYAMLSKPEIYRTVESDEVVYVPFGLGKLADYAIHKDPASILRRLEQVFMQLSAGRPQAQGSGGWLWSSHVCQGNSHHKLLMARQKVGGFPFGRYRNHPTRASFVFSRYPVQMETETPEGERMLTEIRSGSYGTASAALLQFMGKKLCRLRLTWMFKRPEGAPCRRHLILLRDGDRVQMAWLQDDRERADFCWADCPPEAEEARESFLGGQAPAKLIHRDLWRVRNSIDLLLDDIDDTEAVVKEYFLPVADQPYEELLALLVQN